MPYYALAPDDNTTIWSDYNVRVAVRKPLTACTPQAQNDDGPVYPNCWCLEYDAPASDALRALIPDGLFDLTAAECASRLNSLSNPNLSY